MLEMAFLENFWKGSSQYEQLASSPDSESLGVEKGQGSNLQYSRKTAKGHWTYLPVLLSALFAITVLSVLVLHSPTSNHKTHAINTEDSLPSARREWRSLSKDEKLQYISAVQCLRHRPSKIGFEHNLYDDFPWVHSQVGNYSHGTAAFLAWHRYFLVTYETALQDECGYEGRLPYWDWTLDWESLTEAPVWDATLGFGSNGTAAKSNYTLLEGHCVTDGPFADLRVKYIKGKASEHCLTRGFLEPDGAAIHELREWVHPDTILSILNESDYASFNLNLEDNSHVSIPRVVRGDFAILTAPYDPVFYLHHAQLDRLWFMWQQLGADRVTQYMGFTSRDGLVRATPHDILHMGGLAPDISVSQILDTRGGDLSYIYI